MTHRLCSRPSSPTTSVPGFRIRVGHLGNRAERLATRQPRAGKGAECPKNQLSGKPTAQACGIGSSHWEQLAPNNPASNTLP